MVRPAHIAPDPETAASNAFQRSWPGTLAELRRAALAEFDAVVAALSGAGVDVIVAEDRPDTPDAAFPNNWIGTHADGTVVIYPLLAEARRREVRPELVETLAARGYRVARVLRLDAPGVPPLEGTGSLVLHRPSRQAFVCESVRSSELTLRRFERELGYRSHVFRAQDPGGLPVYHTNVLLSVAENFALAGNGCVSDPAERAALLARLHDLTGCVLELSWEQVASFCGNGLSLRGAGGDPLFALSARAERALSPAQRRAIESRAHLLAVPIDAIETVGGGSLRCLLAEVHLPRV